ncbi:hypothetical protein JB92DRAFT_2836169 [Gautieria morchelliformis]|nr:hypothetical protein JB92DRAFT_2836169 [Gautieria morchelliformis]
MTGSLAVRGNKKPLGKSVVLHREGKGGGAKTCGSIARLAGAQRGASWGVQVRGTASEWREECARVSYKGPRDVIKTETPFGEVEWQASLLQGRCVFVESRTELGGRMKNIALENGVDVELGPHCIQGLGERATQNPIFTMDKELTPFADAWSLYLAAAGVRKSQQQVDLTARAGLSVVGYQPHTYLDDAAEYFTFDSTTGHPSEFVQPSEASSFIASADTNNFTFVGFSDANNFVTDQRGFKTIALAEAATILNANDSRLLLNHTLAGIPYSSSIVIIQTSQGVIEADYMLKTFFDEQSILAQKHLTEAEVTVLASSGDYLHDIHPALYIPSGEDGGLAEVSI